MNQELLLIAFSFPDIASIWLIRLVWALEVAVAFGLLVTVHEFGHFVFGKLTRMKVEEFSVGFGKRIFGWKKGETEYSLRVVPLGGFCKIYGMDESEEESSPADSDRAFNKRPLWARFVVIIAGSVMNVILAVVLIAFSGMFIGYSYSLIHEVTQGGPADLAGIKAGDKVRLFAYNSDPGDIGALIRNSDPAKGVKLKIVNDDGRRNVFLHPRIETDEEGRTVKRIGVVFDENSNYSARIERVLFDSPYHKAGLMPDDVITEVDGKPVTGFLSILQALMENPEEKAEIKVKRGESEYKFNLEGYLIHKTGLVAQTVETESGHELVVKNVIFDTPAMSAMLRPGMRILEVDEKPITKDFDWAQYEQSKENLWIKLKIIDQRLSPEPFEIEIQRVMLHPGVSYKAEWIKVPLFTAFGEALSQAKEFGKLIFEVLKGLFTKKTDVADLSGPIGIITFTYKAASWGLVNFIIVISLISVNLGVVNMLPFPGLDGGRTVFLIAELIARKPVINARIENTIHLIGFFLLIALVIFITYFDFGRIFGGVG